MKIIINYNKGKGLEIDFGTSDWDFNEVLGVLERAKLTVYQEMIKEKSNNK